MGFVADDFADVLSDLHEAAGREFTYSRGDEFSISGLTMVPPPAPAMAIEESDGVRLESVSGPFLCLQADLVNGSNEVTPARGDTIADADGRRWDVLQAEELAETGQWRIWTEKAG